MVRGSSRACTLFLLLKNTFLCVSTFDLSCVSIDDLKLVLSWFGRTSIIMISSGTSITFAPFMTQLVDFINWLNTTEVTSLWPITPVQTVTTISVNLKKKLRKHFKRTEPNLVHFGWVKDSFEEAFKILKASLLFDQWCGGGVCRWQSVHSANDGGGKGEFHLSWLNWRLYRAQKTVYFKS